MTSPDRTGRLVFLSGSRKGEELELGITSVTVGSDPNVHVVLAGDRGISPRHSTIRCENGHWIVRDQGSATGTYINFRRVHEQELKDGDVVEFNLGGPRARISIPPTGAAAAAGGDIAPEHAPAPASTAPAGAGGRNPILLAGIAVVAVAGGLYVAFGAGGSGGATTALDPAEVLEQQERDYLTGLLELRSGVQENRAAASASADSIRARIEGLDASTASYEAMASLARDKASSLVLLQVGFLLDGDYISGPTGTGFAVGDGMIVTNAHVAEPHLFALSSEESVLGCTVAALAAAGDAVQTVLSIWHAGAALHYGSTGALDPASASWSSRDEAVEVVARGTATSSDEAFPCDEEGSEVRSGLTVERALSGPDSDLAIIRVRGANLPALELASAAPQEGDPVIALGFPRGLLPQDNGEATADISFGFVGRVTGVLMIDDELLPGGEGGPVLDAEGRVVGVSTVPFGSRIQAIHAEHVRALLRQVG